MATGDKFIFALTDQQIFSPTPACLPAANQKTACPQKTTKPTSKLRGEWAAFDPSGQMA
jgi:hypothetical protein